MNISKVRDVKTPNRGTGLSAGLDFYVPHDFAMVDLNPGQSVNIPSGIHARVPKGCALIAFNKSGVALKKSLQVGACVVDEDYQGEIHLHVTNVGTEPTTVVAGDKLVQFICIPVLYVPADVVPLSDLYDDRTERGSGGFGSTGSR